LPSLSLVKAILPSSPGKVANADNWFANNGSIVKVPDAKIVTPTSRKL
jgi:hypothetical protein